LILADKADNPRVSRSSPEGDLRSQVFFSPRGAPFGGRLLYLRPQALPSTGGSTHLSRRKVPP